MSGSRGPHCWLMLPLPPQLLPLLCRLMGRLPIGCMGRMTAVSACTCASLNQRSDFLLTTCHLHQLCVDAPKEGPEGPVRGGGLLLGEHV